MIDHFSTTLYSPDGSLLYVASSTPQGSNQVEYFDTKSGSPISIFVFNNYISALQPMKDNSSIICLGNALSGTIVTIFKFNYHGNLQSVGMIFILIKLKDNTYQRVF